MNRVTTMMKGEGLHYHYSGSGLPMCGLDGTGLGVILNSAGNSAGRHYHFSYRTKKPL